MTPANFISDSDLKQLQEEFREGPMPCSIHTCGMTIGGHVVGLTVALATNRDGTICEVTVRFPVRPHSSSPGTTTP